MIPLAQMACMFQVALWARLGHCPRLNPVLRYWWTLGVFPIEGYGHTEMIAIDGYRCEIVDGMRVYYGDSLCDSDESEWEELYDVVGRQYVDDYNFDVPDGMDMMDFERGGGPPCSEMTVDVETRPQVDDDPDDSDLVDIRCDDRNLPDALPAIFDKMAVVPMSLPVVVETGPHVGCESDLLLSERDMEVDDTDVIRDIRLLTRPMMFEESATVPLSLPVVVDTETQVDLRWETTSAVVPFGDGCGRPAGWLDSESDCCVIDEIVLAPEMSPFVFMKSAVVPTFLPALSEVCSLAVLAGGSVLRQPPWQL